MGIKKNKNYIIILNYNTAEDVIKLVDHLNSFGDLIEKIIVVDNNSGINDQEKLSLHIYPMLSAELIILKENKGYSIGNNKGIYHLEKEYDLKHGDNLIIMNPDIYISKESFEKTISHFDKIKQESNVVMCSPIMVNPFQDNSIVGWKLPNIRLDVFSLYFKKMKNVFYNDLFREKNKEYFIDCIPGSLLIIDYLSFKEIGYFDENTFLYCEEDIIGYKFKAKNYKTYIDQSTIYEHRHSVSINSYFSLKNKYKILVQSKKVYYFYYYNKEKKVKYNFLRFNYFIFVQLLSLKTKIKGTFK